jgi:hypothetical protein
MEQNFSSDAVAYLVKKFYFLYEAPKFIIVYTSVIWIRSSPFHHVALGNILMLSSQALRSYLDF